MAVGLTPVAVEEHEVEKSSTRTNDTYPPAYSCVDDSTLSSTTESANQKVNSKYIALTEINNGEQCLVRLQDVRRAWQNGSIKVIDVRSPQAYKRIHIPDSINIPEYAIRTKGYLKQEKLLLVNDGKSYEHTLQTCSRLKGSGFHDVSVLAGGIRAWIKRGGAIAVVPNNPGLHQNPISPRQLVSSQQEMEWLFMTDIKDLQPVKQVINSDNILTLDAQRSQLNTKITQMQDNNPSIVPVNIVIITATGNKTVPNKGPIRVSHPNPVFFLEGGLSGYKQYLASHQLLLAKSERGPLIHRGCGG